MFICTKKIDVSGFKYEINQKINEDEFYKLPNFVKLSFKILMNDSSSFKENLIELDKKEIIIESEEIELTKEMENIPDEIISNDE